MERLIPPAACAVVLAAMLLPGVATASTSNTTGLSRGQGTGDPAVQLGQGRAGRAPAPRSCGSVSYTFPHTDGHGHAALNNLTAVGVSCSTARSVASAFLVTGKAPKNWHATIKLTSGEEIFTRGRARVTGDPAN